MCASMKACRAIGASRKSIARRHHSLPDAGTPNQCVGAKSANRARAAFFGLKENNRRRARIVDKRLLARQRRARHVMKKLGPLK